MTDVTTRTVGKTSVEREKAAAGALLLGAVVLLFTTAVLDLSPWASLLVLGGVILVAWLVDGTNQRYLGPGMGAVGVGGGITLGQALGIQPPVTYEHILVYGFLGVGLLVVTFLHPAATRGFAAFLVLTALSATNMNFGVKFSLGWELAAIAAVWGVLQLIRIQRSRPTANP